MDHNYQKIIIVEDKKILCYCLMLNDTGFEILIERLL